MAVVRESPHDTEQWRTALLGLLPQGRIWDEERVNPESELYKEAHLWAQMLAELEGVLLGSLAESSPLTAVKTLQQWAQSAGLVFRAGADKAAELSVRIASVIRILASYTSTAQGIEGIAMLLGYRVRIEPHESALPDTLAASYFGEYALGQARLGGSEYLHRTVWLHSDAAEFQALLADIEQEPLALCGATTCGNRLWQSQQMLSDTLLGTDKHKELAADIRLLLDLLPAHLVKLLRLE